MSAWSIILIVCLSVVLLFWLVFGINWRSSRNYKRRHHQLQSMMQAENTEALQSLLFSDEAAMRVEQRFRPLATLLAKNGRPAVSTSGQEIITSGARKYELLMTDLLNARESIHMEYFHFGIDKSSRRIRRLLMAKAKAGVKVRFINENIANFPVPYFYFRLMKRAGVEVVNFSHTPLSPIRFLLTLSYRDHRKIVVIDNRIGYTGGMNINEHYFRQWRDTHVRLTGDAVGSLQYAFLDSWLASGGRLQSALNTFFHIDKLSDEFHSHTLTQITPDDPTSAKLFLRSGEFMHSKTIVCDDYLFCVGSTNLDYRSFGIDYEINTFFYDWDIALQQKQIFEADLPICHPLTVSEAHATRFQRFMHHLAPIV